MCKRPAGDEYAVKDDRPVLEFYYAHKDDDAKTLAEAVLSNESFWGEDLTKVAGLTEAVTRDLETIRTEGAYAAMKSVQ